MEEDDDSFEFLPSFLGGSIGIGLIQKLISTSTPPPGKELPDGYGGKLQQHDADRLEGKARFP